MTLIYVYYWGDEGCSGTSHLVFDYESKEKFVFDVLEKFKNKEWKKYGDNYEKTPLFSNFNDLNLDKFDIENIEHDVFTLDEWVSHNLQTLTL